MKARWENEKNSIGKVQKLREEIEHMGGEIAEAERNYDLNRAAELKYGKLPQLQKELAEQEKIAEEAKSDSTLLRDKVTEEEIARIVARWTGIPVSKLMEGEREKRFIWMIRCISASSVRMKRLKRSVKLFSVVVQASRIRTARLARSCSSVRQALAKPNWQKLLLRHCLMTKRTWFAST